MPYRLPIVSYTPLSHTPPGGMERSAEASAHRNSDISVAGEPERDSQVAGPVQKKNKQTNRQHHEPAPPNLQGRGPLAPQPQAPTPSCPYLLAPIGALVDVSWQQRSPEARRGIADLPAEDGSCGGHGEPDQDAEDQASLFFCSRFFPEPNVLYPVSPYLLGRVS